MKRLLIIGAAIFTSTFPLITHAFDPFRGPIVPKCYSGAPYCQACDLIQLANNLIQFSVGLAVIVATLMFAYAGFLYVTASANPNNLDKAKKLFGTVFLGFVLVLTAWIIVDLTLTVFTNKGFGDRNLGCVDISREVQQNTDTDGASVTTPPEVTTAVTNEQRILDEQIRDQLAVHDIGVNKDICPHDQATNCTDVWGLNEETIRYAIEVSQACGCSTMITGGSEKEPHQEGFFSHGEGYKLDYGRNSNPELFEWLDAGNELPGGANIYLENRGTSNEHYDICVGCP